MVDDDFASPQYWTRHIRNRCVSPTAFASRIRPGQPLPRGGPGGGLTTSIEESLPDVEPVSLPMLRKDRPEPASLTAAVAQAFVSGMAVDWRAMLPAAALWSCRRMPLSDAAFGCPATVGPLTLPFGLAASDHALLARSWNCPSQARGVDGPSVDGVAPLVERPCREGVVVFPAPVLWSGHSRC
ncbi:phenolphthiocerol synthesis polyketide synthase type I Pks15/1 domain protein [Mycobacterium xenopi 4042]|uniref:Phenolphthiocerol synthesis polyketide synthase type I Pks15/1 domain protein n=1 Tax=Mycobacterium xenopi 4042 TaxID=1299334 RepID=X7Z034_MYCXE|nr:phenolphthiocerol synthesis polyketide synthase type I Pks15/1 domain protein [Mycobacterium xenopi 4042]